MQHYEVNLLENNNLSLFETIINRGHIVAGVSDDIPSLGFKDNGEFQGFDIDFVRALAAAVFGDPNAVEFVVQTLPERFTNVANGIVDVTSQQATFDLVRDAAFNVDFAPITLYDGQVLMVQANSNFTKLSDLANHRIGVRGETTAQQNLDDAFNNINLTFEAVTYDSLEKLLDAFKKGKIDAVSNDATALISISPSEARIIGEPLSKQPMAMVVPENESEWADVVRWVNYVPIQAQEFGITSKNVDDFVANSTNPAIQRFLGVKGNLGQSLGLSNDFAVNIIKSVGNFNEIIDRNFGSVVGKSNGFLYFNNLCTNEIQSSPPFSGEVVTTNSFSLLNNANTFNSTFNFAVAKEGTQKTLELSVLPKFTPLEAQLVNPSSVIYFCNWTTIVVVVLVLIVSALKLVSKWMLHIQESLHKEKVIEKNFHT